LSVDQRHSFEDGRGVQLLSFFYYEAQIKSVVLVC